MKRNIIKIGLFSALVLTSATTFATSHSYTSKGITHDSLKTETFKVYGNCGMCEKTIEGSLKGIKGIKKADWNKDTKMMEVTFDKTLITLEKIKKKIAGVGYDTDEFKASEESYNSLPGCCQYERPEK